MDDKIGLLRWQYSAPRSRSSSRVIAPYMLWIGISIFALCLGYRSLLYLSELRKDFNEWQDLPIGTVKWRDCSEPDLLLDCGYIIVPTDYTDLSAGASKFALRRVRAAKKPSQGIVFLNPGGPGVPGTLMANAHAPVLLGEDWDFVGFDPRGIGSTEPAVNCFGGIEARKAFLRNTVLDRSFDLGPNLTDHDLRQHLLRSQREADTLYQAQFDLCGKAMGEKLRYMGTTTVVRDIAFMADVLTGKDSSINYYGGSYGSILGQYLVNMYPERMGRVAIDGIADAVTWSSSPPHKYYGQWLGYTEETYDLFFTECSRVGPSKCALARSIGEDPSAIRDRLETFFDDLYETPLPVSDGTRPGILTAGQARKYFFVGLYLPRMWPNVSQVMANAISGKDLPPLMGSLFSEYVTGRDLERSAVSCNDQPSEYLYKHPPTDEEIVDGMLRIAKEQTKFAWSLTSVEPDSGCQHWYPNVGNPPERFTGPWNHTLANKMLVLSATIDPVTPISSARKVKHLLGESVKLVTQTTPGHGTYALPSLCIGKVIRAYFANGNLPEDEDYVCQSDRSPFDGEEWDLSAYSLEEVKLIHALGYLGDFTNGLQDGNQRR